MQPDHTTETTRHRRSSRLRGMTAVLRRYLISGQAGDRVLMEDLRDNVLIPEGYPAGRKAILAAMSYLTRSGEVPYAQTGPGRGVWVKNSPALRITGDTIRVATIAPPTSTLYETVGTARNGRPIVRGEDGTLYEVTPL